MEKQTTSSKITACGSCGSSRVESSLLEGMAVRPERVSTLKKVFNVGGQVFCVVCLDCGALSGLRADPAAVAQMLE